MNVRHISLVLSAGLMIAAATPIVAGLAPSADRTPQERNDASDDDAQGAQDVDTTVVSQGITDETVPSIFAGVSAAVLTIGLAAVVLVRRSSDDA